MREDMICASGGKPGSDIAVSQVLRDMAIGVEMQILPGRDYFCSIPNFSSSQEEERYTDVFVLSVNF